MMKKTLNIRHFSMLTLDFIKDFHRIYMLQKEEYLYLKSD